MTSKGIPALRADCIHYMENGRIVASGPHERLMELLAAKMEDGVILIPKENGLFQCREPIVTKIFD